MAGEQMSKLKRELPASILKKALDVVSSSVVVTDYRQEQNPIVFVNRAFEESTGYKREEIIGLNPRFLHGSDRKQPGLDELAAAIAAGRECKVNIRDYRKDKSAYWTEVSVFPIYNEQHEITHFVGVQRDLTGIEAHKLKSQFVANVSHEVRTPLSGIIGLLEMTLMEDGIQPDMRETLERALDASKELLTVLNSLLDFSTLEAGHFHLSKQRFCLRDLIGEVVAIFSAAASAKGLKLFARVDEILPKYFSGDVQKIKQVLLNLTENALKFTETGEIALRVEADSITPQQVLVRFLVADTGIGISEDAQSLFQPFVQADGAFHRRFGGTGLGLSIAKGFVEAMDGRISVKGAPGAGATFWFTLCLEIEHDG
jgi:two-component system, sensor histidine kinase and response regulator